MLVHKTAWNEVSEILLDTNMRPSRRQSATIQMEQSGFRGEICEDVRNRVMEKIF
jgi:hypothetical protein